MDISATGVVERRMPRVTPPRAGRPEPTIGGVWLATLRSPGEWTACSDRDARRRGGSRLGENAVNAAQAGQPQRRQI
jgi:hypothetical protein